MASAWIVLKFGGTSVSSLANWRNIAKVIEKSQFANRQELLTFRRMIRRHVADNELLHD